MEMMLTSATGWFSDNSHTNENMKEFLNNFRNFPGASDELLVKAYDKISEIFQISMDGTYSEMSIDDGHEEWFNPDVNNTYDEEHKIRLALLEILQGLPNTSQENVTSCSSRN